MQAVRIVEGQSDFVVEEIAEPQRRPDGIVVRLEAAMVASYMAALPSGGWMTPPRPFIPGQCAIGVVEEGNAQFLKGQRVYFDAYTGSRDPSDPAADHGFLGCFAVGEAAMLMMRAWPDGSFAELIHAPATCFTPIPDDLKVAAERLCRLGWLGTACRGLEQGGFTAGMGIAINGATGIVGASAVALALALGAAEITIFGRRNDRLSELVALDSARVRIGRIEDDRHYDLVLDCAAGPDSGISAALIAQLRRFGKAVFVGGLSEPIALDSAALMRNGNTVAGSYWFTRKNLNQLICMAEAGLLDFGLFRAKSFRIDDIHAAIRHATSTAGGLEHTVLTP